MQKKERAFWVGVNDYDKPVKIKGKHIQSYIIWKGMLERCYCPDHETKYPAYTDCKVCKEWLSFSNFKQWYDNNYIEGWEIDKDLLSGKNKTYSPETCCFLPREINTFLSSNRTGRRSKYPGVNYRARTNHYISQIRFHRHQIHIGVYETEKEAYEAYCKKKVEYVRELAEEYKDKLPSKTYISLMNYKLQ